jgi:hypothetical protein
MDVILGQYSNGDISVTSLTVTRMVIDVWWQRMASYIPSQFVQAGSKDADGAKTKTKTKVRKWRYYLHVYLQAAEHGENIWVQQTPGFSSLAIKTGKRRNIFTSLTLEFWTTSSYGLRARSNCLAETSDLWISHGQNLLESEIVLYHLMKAGFENHTSSQETGL